MAIRGFHQQWPKMNDRFDAIGRCLKRSGSIILTPANKKASQLTSQPAGEPTSAEAIKIRPRPRRSSLVAVDWPYISL